LKIALTIWVASTIWCSAVVPPVQTVTLAWDSQAASNVVYRIYENGVTTNVIAITTNQLSVTISNVLAAPHRWTVTASNMWGESDPSVPLVVPAAPVPPQNLKPISTTLNVPVPGIIESTTDLANWRTRYRLATASDGVVLTQFIAPSERMEFMRSKVLTAVVPPLP
jgi:hypothetical protein